MRLSTIWTLPSMSTIERLRRTQEWSMMEIAARLPQKIKYWTVMQEVAKATKTQKGPVMAITLDEILSKLEHG